MKKSLKTKISNLLLVFVFIFNLYYCSSIPSDSPDEDSKSERLTNKGNLHFYSWHIYSERVTFFFDQSIWIFYTDSMKWQKLTEITDSNGSFTFLDWSPDGNQILYQFRDINNVGFKIFDIDNKSHSTLNFSGSYPRWSPKGDSIAFINFDSNSQNRMLSFYSISKHDTINILKHTELVNWSPDAKQIVHLDESTINLYDINLGISHKVGEYHSPGGIKYPSFSPSGNYILFNAMSESEEGKDHLVIFSLLDNTIIEVPYSDHSWFPMWTNNENKIAFMYDQDLWIKDVQGLLY